MARKSTPSNEQAAEVRGGDRKGLSAEEHEREVQRLLRQFDSDDLEWVWTFNQWLRNAGSTLVAGGGIAVAYLVSGQPLGYQAASFFYIAFAIVLGAGCVLYRYVKKNMRDNASNIWWMAIPFIYYLAGGIGTAISHKGPFAPWPRGRPITAYTDDWWKVIVVSFSGALIGLGLRFSADKSDRSVDRKLAAIAAASARAEKREEESS